MKHRMGNSPMCFECISYREHEGENHPNGKEFGWCVNPKAQGVNGRKPTKPRERMAVRMNEECRHWIDAESGHTHFEVNTGYKEPYDGTRINFDEEREETLKMEGF